MDSLSEEIEFSPGDHDSNPRAFQRTNVFGCSSPRMGLLAAGITELVLGTIGLALIVLGPQQRHTVLHPLEEYHKVKVYSEQWEYTIQLLIEFWLPSFAYWVLGAVLVVAAVTGRMTLLIFWVLISTLLLAGSVAGILGLLVAGASLIGLLPLIIATLLQMYFYFAISDMTYAQWKVAKAESDDKEMLVIQSST